MTTLLVELLLLHELGESLLQPLEPLHERERLDALPSRGEDVRHLLPREAAIQPEREERLILLRERLAQLLERVPLPLDALLYFTVIRPVSRFAARADEISKGQLDVPELPVHGRDEISEILSAAGEPVQPLALMKRFERLKKRLAEIVREQAAKE